MEGLNENLIKDCSKCVFVINLLLDFFVRKIFICYIMIKNFFVIFK